MTANSPSSVAELPIRTIDPDVQARRASDGELSTPFRSDVKNDQDAVNGLSTREGSVARIDQNLDGGSLYADYGRLAAEQAALRRLATLVAGGVELMAVFGAVADEMRRCVPADTAGLWRFELDREITILAGAAHPAARTQWPSGTRTPLEGNTIATTVLRTARPARVDNDENVGGSIGARVREVGLSAAVGVPIIVDGCVWGLAAVASVQGPMPADTEVRIGRFAELAATALMAGYRDAHALPLLADASRRSDLIDSLLKGRAFDDRSLRDVAGYLRLPMNGRFVVVAAQIPSAGDDPLAEIESMLRSLDIFSAWRLLPDMRVGIVHVKSDQQLDMIVALLSRITTVRVGVSAAFEDLRDTPRALHVARVMLRGPTDSICSVAVFDGSILATAAVCAQEALIRTVGTALDCFGDIADEDRERLFETFRVWQDSDASVRRAAEILFCHPNTVRYRLHRIEELTGRSLSRPRDVAELCLAFEVHRRLM